jgi:hypothetical protein
MSATGATCFPEPPSLSVSARRSRRSGRTTPNGGERAPPNRCSAASPAPTSASPRPAGRSCCGSHRPARSPTPWRRYSGFAGDLIQDDRVRDFYATVAVEAGDGRLAEIYRLDIGGAPAGYVYGLGHRGRFYYLLIGCDYENHGRASPGLVLYDRIIADWIGRGGDVFDFTIGDERFKADFGTETTPMFALVDAPTWRGKLALAAFRAHAQLRKSAGNSKSGEDAHASPGTGGDK